MGKASRNKQSKNLGNKINSDSGRVAVKKSTKGVKRKRPELPVVAASPGNGDQTVNKQIESDNNSPRVKRQNT